MPLWIDQPKYLTLLESGLKALPTAAAEILVRDNKIAPYSPVKKRQVALPITAIVKTTNPNKPSSQEMFALSINRSDEQISKPKEAVEKIELKILIESEVSKFRDLLKTDAFKNMSTKNFWIEYGRILPNLKKVAIILLNVQASSSPIERFFSVAGVVCKNRATNMKDDLIQQRSFLKVNIHFMHIIQ